MNIISDVAFLEMYTVGSSVVIPICGRCVFVSNVVRGVFMPWEAGIQK